MIGKTIAHPAFHRHGTDGRPNAQASARGKVTKVEQLLELAIQIADPLDAAHAKGIVHATSSPPISS
jgi:hypothetical protein